jgi:hypothetical protein
MSGFWSTANGNSEPKRNYRFLVQLDGLNTSPLWYAKSVGLPNYTVTNVSHTFLDNEYHFPGKVQWQEISLTLVDPISENAVKQTNQMIINSGYTVPAAPVGVGDSSASTLSKSKMNNDGLKSVTITVIDSEGSQVEKWTLMNPILTSAKFGDLDYTNEDLKTVEIGLKYDWAECDSKTADQQFKAGTPS